MGWLVQAEAPPGVLFRKFRSMISDGSASLRDVAFYLTHWLTDLAGAEPCPMEGCEKFVLKFPMQVLMSFLDSFSFVQRLSQQTETQVYEAYLQWRWSSHQPALGPVPCGKGSVAKLRLVVMAQSHSGRVLSGYEEMAERYRDVLDVELARTGCVSQSFARDGLASEGGPAFLVYYAPALMQTNSSGDTTGALTVLAEVLKQARELWPLARDRGDETVTIRIDALKDSKVLDMHDLKHGECWALCRASKVDAVVKKVNVASEEHVDWSSLRLLIFGSSENLVFWI